MKKTGAIEPRRSKAEGVVTTECRSSERVEYMSDVDFDELTSDERAPLQGWDNPHDVDDAKRKIRDLQYALVGPHAGKHAFDLGASLYDLGISQKLADELIFEICTLPEEKPIRAEIERVYSVLTHPPGLKSHAPGNDADAWAERFKGDVEDPDAWLEGGQFTDGSGPRVWPKPISYQGRHGAKNADLFLAERPTRLISSDGLLYSFENRIWREIPETMLAAEIRATDPKLYLDTGNINSMVNAIHLARFTTARPYGWLEKPENAPAECDLILFRNGILDFASGELLPHDGRYFATGLPDFEFDPAKTCPRYDRFLNEVLHPSFHDTLHEFAGYAMTPDNSLGKMLALIGAGRGGKSTLAHILQLLCGPYHSISRSLTDLGGEFGLEGTMDKRLLTIPDAHDADIHKRSVALNRLKAISGNDDVGINRKNLPIVTARLIARIVIVANRHPKFLDESGALEAREIPLIFETTFRGREDFELAEKLEAELPGIANRALEGLRRLRNNGGKFTIGAKGRLAIQQIGESQSPALRFAKERLIVTGNRADYASLADVFEAYEDWANFAESLGRAEKRNRDDFKNDLVAALTVHGVGYTRLRWHDPTKPKRRKGELKWGFFGVRIKKVRVPE